MSSTSQRLLLPLDLQQRAALQASQGHLLVRGGAGTGRTQTLLARADHLLTEGVLPGWVHVLLTSTYAVQDWRRRVTDGIEDPHLMRHIFVGTIHAAADKYLRIQGNELIGQPPNYTIWDQQRAAAAMGRVARQVLPKNDRKSRQIDHIMHWYVVNRNRFHLERPTTADEPVWHDVVDRYEAVKREMGAP